MTVQKKISICVIIVGLAYIASVIFNLQCQTLLAACAGACIGILIGSHILAKYQTVAENKYNELYYTANRELISFGRAIMYNPKKHGFNFDVVDMPAPTLCKEKVLASCESDIPNFLVKFSDFKELVYGVVATLGSEALSKQSDNLTYKLHMLKLMQDQAVRDCAGVWLRREGRQKLRIYVEDVVNVHMEWVDNTPEEKEGK